MIASKRVRRRTLLAAGLAAPAAGLTAACSGDDPQRAQAGQPRRVTYATGFGTNGRDGFPWISLAKGYFSNAGLDVSITPGVGAEDNIKLLLSGEAQFATGDFVGACIAAANGGLVGWRAIAAIQQQSLAAVMSHLPEIQVPIDLEGPREGPPRKIGLPIGAVTGDLFAKWAELSGINLDRVEQILMRPNELIPAITTGDVDAIGQFIPAKGTVEAVLGEPVRVFDYRDQFPEIPGQSLLVAEETAEKEPELCIAFRDPLLRGLEDSITNPTNGGEIMESYPELQVEDPSIPAGEMAAMAPYVNPFGQIGALTEFQVIRTISVLQGANVLQNPLHPDELVSWNLMPGGGKG